MNMKHCLGLLLCLLLLSAAAAAETLPKLTMMVYMTGSDLESTGGAASADLAEMSSAIPADGELQLIILTGGTKAWHSDIPADHPAAWRITPAGRELLWQDTTGDTMGDGSLLQRFLTRCVADFPAQAYALVLWDHGAGPLGGVCYDETTLADGSMDHLTLQELTDALSLTCFAEQPLMLLGFDACLMATAEVACAAAPYARYMVASQEPEPASGWDYSFLSTLTQAEDGAQAGRMIVDAYAASMQDTLSPVTLSCLDLAAAPALESALNALFGSLTPADPEVYEVLAACRADTKALGAASGSDWDLADARDLLEMLADEGLPGTDEALAVLDRMIVSSFTNERYVHGLSIYAPFDNKPRYIQPWGVSYAGLPFAEGYRSYLRDFSAQWLSENALAWKSPAEITALSEAHRTVIRASLDTDQAIVRIRLLVLEQNEYDEYRLLWQSDDVQHSGAECSAVYRSESLYLLDGEGSILAGPLTWRSVDGGLIISAIWEDAQAVQHPVNLLYCQDADGKLRLAQVYEHSDAIGMFVPSALKLDPSGSLTIASWTRTWPETDAPYTAWPYGDHVDLAHLAGPQEDWTLASLPLASSGRHIAVFELTDAYGNTHLTPAVELPEQGREAVLAKRSHGETEGLAWALQDVSMFVEADPGLQLSLSFTNQLDHEWRPELVSVMVDSVVLSDLRLTWSPMLQPGADTPFSFTIPAEQLARAGIRQASELSLLFRARDHEPFIISFPLLADLGAIVPAAEAFLPVLEVEADGFRMSMGTLTMHEGGVVEAPLRIANLRGDLRSATLTDVLANSQAITGSLGRQVSPLLLPGYSTVCCTMRLFLEDWDGTPILTLGSADELTSLTLTLRTDDGYVEFPLIQS